MFGIFALIIIVVYAIYSGILNNIDDYHNRKNLRDVKTNTYIDHNGVSRDLYTNKYRSITTEYNGDRHMRGKDIGDINLSQIDRQKEFEKYRYAPVKGRTTVYWEPSPNYKLGEPILLGKRYKDLSTERILVVRSNNWLNYYVDTETLEVLRYTDSQKRELEKSNHYSREKEIKDVEEFQQLIDKQRNDLSYIGDPTHGKPTYTARLEDYWKPEKMYY